MSNMESTTPDKYFVGSAYKCKSKSTLVDYHHASYWSPTESGWGKSITKKFFTYWPGLSLDLVNKHLSEKQLEPDTEQYQLPPSTQSEDTNLVFLKTLDLTGIFYTD